MCTSYSISLNLLTERRERARGEEKTRCGKINRRNVRSDTRKRLCFDVSDYRTVAFGKGIRNFDGNVIGWRKKKDRRASIGRIKLFRPLSIAAAWQFSFSSKPVKLDQPCVWRVPVTREPINKPLRRFCYNKFVKWLIHMIYIYIISISAKLLHF